MAQESSTKPPLNLGSTLRQDIITCFIKFSDSLNGHVNNDNDKELVQLNNKLYERLSVLSTGNGERSAEDLFYLLSWNQRINIIGLLIKNLSGCSLSDKEDKKILIQENNALIHELLNLDVKSCDANSIEDGEIGGDQIDNKVDSGVIYDRPSKRLKLEPIDPWNKLIEKIDKLEEKVKEVDTRNNEVTFSFELKNVKEFLSEKSGRRRVIRSENFWCSSVSWFVEARSNYPKNGMKHIELFLFINEYDEEFSNWHLKVDKLVFKLLHPTDTDLNKSTEFENLKFTKKFNNWGSEVIDQKTLKNYVNDDTITFKISLKANKIVKLEYMNR